MKRRALRQQHINRDGTLREQATCSVNTHNEKQADKTLPLSDFEMILNYPPRYFVQK